MTKHYTYTAKQTGDTLSAVEWNNLGLDVDAAVDAINAGSTGTGNIVIGNAEGDSHIYLNAKGNLCIETTATNTPAEKKGKINIESRDDIQIKPGDDFTIVSSHRPVANMDEVSVKIHDGEDHPVKLQLNTADIVLTTKDKDKTMEKDSNGDDTTTPMYSDPTVMNVTVNSAKNTRGYLKVRAQAIDLRSESHGGIALQPKGYDNESNMNKIKFEHGGGDGLEFATFNTEKTSIFTDEYRFNKSGVWKMATRTMGDSDKYDSNDETTHYKYTKLSDDFYDIISANDATATTKDIIDTAAAFTQNDARIDSDGVLFANNTIDPTANTILYLGTSYTQDMNEHRYGTTTISSTTTPGNDTFSVGEYYSLQNIIAEFNIADPTSSLSATRYLIIRVTSGSGVTAVTRDYCFDLYVHCDLKDVILLTQYMKTNSLGPWGSSSSSSSNSGSSSSGDNSSAGGIS